MSVPTSCPHVRPPSSLRVTLAGDLLMHRSLQEEAFRQTPPSYRFIYDGEAAQHLRAADVAYMNFEGVSAAGVGANHKEGNDTGAVFGPVYTSWSRDPSKPSPNAFNYHPSVVDSLARAGIDVVSTANNHAADRGSLGITKTLQALRKAGISTTGTRDRDLTVAPHDYDWLAVVRRANMSVGFLSCTDWVNSAALAHSDKAEVHRIHDMLLHCGSANDGSANGERAVMSSLVQQANKRVDLLIAIAHVSEGEYSSAPGPRAVAFARRLLGAGAHVALIMHPHVLQGWHVSGHVGGEGGIARGLTAFSLGSFISGMGLVKGDPRGTTRLNLGAMLTLDVQRHQTGSVEIACANFTLLCKQRRRVGNLSETATLLAARHPECSEEYALGTQLMGEPLDAPGSPSSLASSSPSSSPSSSGRSSSGPAHMEHEASPAMSPAHMEHEDSPAHVEHEHSSHCPASFAAALSTSSQTGSGLFQALDAPYCMPTKSNSTHTRLAPHKLAVRHALETRCLVPIFDHGAPLIDLSGCCAVFDAAVNASSLGDVWDALLFPFDSKSALCCGGTTVFHETMHVLAAVTARHAASRRHIPLSMMASFLYQETRLSIPGSVAHVGAPIHGAMWQLLIEDVPANGIPSHARFWELHDANCNTLTPLSMFMAETCSHGMGHAALTLLLTRSHREYSTCRPFRRRSVPIDETILLEAEAFCGAAPSGFLQARCADGLYHHFFKYSDAWHDRSVPWHWPCTQSRLFASACFFRAMYNAPLTSMDWVIYKVVRANGWSSASAHAVIAELDCEAAPIPVAVQPDCYRILASQATRWTKGAPYDCTGARSAENRQGCIDGVANGLVKAKSSLHLACTNATKNGTLAEVSWCLRRVRFYQQAAQKGMAHLAHMPMGSVSVNTNGTLDHT